MGQKRKSRLHNRPKERPLEGRSSRANRRTDPNLGGPHLAKADVIAGQEERRYTQNTATIIRPLLMRGSRDQSRQRQPQLPMYEFGSKMVPWVWWPAPCCTGCQIQTPSTCAK